MTFATDVETATDIAAEFNRRGVPAAVVSAKTPDSERIAILRRFKNRELLQLVNVDLFGEGFDLPAIEVVSMARPTQSYALFVQQFGRALRLMIDPSLYPQWDRFTDQQRRDHIAASSKSHAIIIDHVGNVDRHNLPDAPRVWTLDRREKRAKSDVSDVIPTKSCPKCTGVYERIYAVCPFCGFKPLVLPRSGPEQVDGDLIELDVDMLAAMRGEIEKVNMSQDEFRQDMVNRYVPAIGQKAGMKRHLEQQQAQEALRASIAWWAGYQRAQGRADSESYRRFYFRFGVDVMTAQTFKTTEALTLADNVNRELSKYGYS